MTTSTAYDDKILPGYTSSAAAHTTDGIGEKPEDYVYEKEEERKVMKKDRLSSNLNSRFLAPQLLVVRRRRTDLYPYSSVDQIKDYLLNLKYFEPLFLLTGPV